MTTTALPTTGLDVIEALDFDPDVACEYVAYPCLPGERHPADWYVASHCRGPLPICDAALDFDRRESASGMYGATVCFTCGVSFPPRLLTVLGPVRTH